MKNQYDQFYTNPRVCDQLIKRIFELFPTFKSKKFLEPSAGTGNFVYSLLKSGIKKEKISSYDIDPKSIENLNITKADFLLLNIAYDRDTITIGNPPFGKRGKLALDFLNKCLSITDIVCFVVPNTFNRYSIQKNVKEGSKLILNYKLEEDSFIVGDYPYKVKCTFQVWTSSNLFPELPNIRIVSQPEIRHPDFVTWIHNNTPSTLKYFDRRAYKWNIAVVRQGYYDYNEIIVDSKKLIKNRQYIFVKFISKDAEEVFKHIDFNELSKTNTQVLGFSTSDLVKEYKRIKKGIL